MEKIFKIHEEHFPEVKETIKALNKKFRKYNIPEVVAEFSEKDDFDCSEVKITYSEVPSITGVEYKYLGNIYDEDGQKVYNGFEETEDFKTIRKMNCTCSLCRKVISRNRYFVFKKEGKEIEMFGSTCAKSVFPFNIDFYFGGLDRVFEDIEQLSGMDGFDPDGNLSFGGKIYFHIDRLIDELKKETNDFTNWVSRDKAESSYPRELSTKEKVLRNIIK